MKTKKQIEEEIKERTIKFINSKTLSERRRNRTIISTLKAVLEEKGVQHEIKWLSDKK